MTETIETGPNREVDLLLTEEEKLDDLEFLRIKSESEMQESAISEERDNTPTLENSCKQKGSR